MGQPDSNATDRLWTADEVADFLGIHPQTVYAKARTGEIPSFKVGGARRFRRSEIEAWVEAHTEAPRDPVLASSTADAAKQAKADRRAS